VVARLRLTALGLAVGLIAAASNAPIARAQSEDDLFARVFNQRAQAPQTIELDLDLTTQGVLLGQVRSTLAGNAVVDLDRPALLALLETFVAEDRLLPLQSDAPRIDPAELAEAGMALDYDPAELALTLTVPPEYRIEWQVPIAPLRPPAQGRVRYGGATFSAGLNLLPSLSHDSVTGRTDSAVNANGFANVAGWAIESDLAWSERLGHVRRGALRLHRDFESQRIRLTVGELNSPSFGLQPSLPLRGISIGRVFAIDPYDPPFPGLAAALLLEAPTEVEVLVDGRRVERVRLPAGPVLLEDFPLRVGLNDVAVNLYQDGQLQRRLDYQGWFDRVRLGVGRQEFHLTLGQRWFLGERRPQVDRDDLWLSAAIRRGLTSRWTSGLGLLADRSTGDAVLDWSNDLGFAFWSLGSNLAISRGEQLGTAGTLSLQQEAMRGRRWSLRMSTGWRDAHFLPFGLEDPPGREWRSALTASRALGERVRFSTSLRALRQPDQRQLRLNSVLAWRPRPAWSVQLQAAAQRGDGQSDLGLTLTLDWRPRGSDHAWTGEMNDAADWLAGWRFNQQTARRGRSASLVVQEADGERVTSGALAMRNHRIRAGIDHRRSDGTGSQTRFAAQTALVFADGHLGMADRVGGGFVLFAARPDTGRVDVNPSDDDYRSRSDGLGPAVVGDLTPYFERGFTVGLPEVPIQTDPGDLQPVVRAGFLQGVVVPVGPEATVSVEMILEDASGERLALGVGELVPEGEGEARMFFSNRSGEVALGGIPPGNYRLKVPAAGIDRPVEVGPTPALQNLGVIQP
jgi:outer membrane usher protein